MVTENHSALSKDLAQGLGLHKFSSIGHVRADIFYVVLNQLNTVVN